MINPEVFQVIDPVQYFNTRAATAQWWIKVASIAARPAKEGEVIETVINGLVETTNTAKAGDMLVKNPGGECYLVPAEKFVAKYQSTDSAMDIEGFSSHRSISKPVRCVKFDDNVQFTASWGEEMRIEKGGFMVCAGEGDYYGVAPAAFKQTYSRCNEEGELIS